MTERGKTEMHGERNISEKGSRLKKDTLRVGDCVSDREREKQRDAGRKIDNHSMRE